MERILPQMIMYGWNP